MKINKFNACGSFLGFILLTLGSVVMTVCVMIAVGKIDDFFLKYFFPVYSIVYIKAYSCCVTAAALIIAAIIVIFSIYSNKTTQKSVYRGDSCFIGGKNSATILIGVNFGSFIVWIGTLTALVIPCLHFVIFNSICFYQLLPNSTFNYIFNLTYYGIYERPYLYDVSLNYREAITKESDFQFFCKQNSAIGPLFVLALAGSVLVLFSLAIFAGYLSASYSRLKFTREIQEYRKLVDLTKQAAYQ